MICFSREYLRSRRLHRIRLSRCASLVLFTGASKERINAVFDRDDRLVRLIVHTKTKSVR